jgi:hypothetical protein
MNTRRVIRVLTSKIQDPFRLTQWTIVFKSEVLVGNSQKELFYRPDRGSGDTSQNSWGVKVYIAPTSKLPSSCVGFKE